MRMLPTQAKLTVFLQTHTVRNALMVMLRALEMRSAVFLDVHADVRSADRLPMSQPSTLSTSHSRFITKHGKLTP